jgi:hypothetical protein
MRKRYRVLILAALVAALVVPVGFALSLESPMPSQSSLAVASHPALWPLVPDTLKLFAVGGVLIGLASVGRRTT